jgi:hypothetical protein
MTAARRTAAAAGTTVLQAMSVFGALAGMLRCWASPQASTAEQRYRFTGVVRRAASDLLMPTIFKAARVVPMIGGNGNNSTLSSSNELPTIGTTAPTIADHRQDGRNGRQACCTDNRYAIARFNDRQRAAATGIQAQPIGKPKITVDGPTAASAFVRWVAKHDLAGEWKVDDLWHLASEDFAPALSMVLPPRRVFLGALKKTPGVNCTPNRRIFDRSGKLVGKTTFYQLPASPAVRTAAETPALMVVKHAA